MAPKDEPSLWNRGFWRRSCFSCGAEPRGRQFLGPQRSLPAPGARLTPPHHGVRVGERMGHTGGELVCEGERCERESENPSRAMCGPVVRALGEQA